MAFTCKGRCDEFRLKNPRECLNHVKQKKFAQGWKWCKLCRIATKTAEKYCFCCSMQLRTRTRVRAVFEDVIPPPRVCAVCDGTKTYITPQGWEYWNHYGDEFICHGCYHYIRYERLKTVAEAVSQ